MSHKVIDLVTDDNVRQLATREAIASGHALLERGEVIFGVFLPELVEGTVNVSDTESHATRLRMADDGLVWECDCGADPTVFCEHLVTVALDSQREGRGDIYKSSGILIKDRKLLVERSVGKRAFIAPGGRMEPGETPEQSVIRELQEECGITIDPADLEPFGTFSAEAANHPGQQVHMHVFMVRKWQGEIAPNNEVEEMRWLTSDIPADIEVGSIFAHEILPRLKAQGLVD